MKELKSQILKREDGKQVWDQAIASHIEHLFDNLPASADRNLGEAFANIVLGRKKQRGILAAAMDENQFRTLTDFVEVLKRTGITAPKSAVGIGRGQARKQLKREFESETLTVLTTPLRTPKRLVADRVNELRFGRGARELAELLLSDTSFKQVAKLKRLRPRSRQLIESLGVFLGMNLGQSTENKVAKEFLQDRLPGGS